MSKQGTIIVIDDNKGVLSAVKLLLKEGSGIGLSLSKQIMRLSGGTLTLLPYKEKGQATVFVLVFN